MIEKNEFFREATLRICGNLKLVEALHSAFDYIRKEIPIDRMFLQFSDTDNKQMRIIADANKNKVEEVDWIAPLSNKALEELKNFAEEFSQQDKHFLWFFDDNPRQLKLVDDVLNIVGSEASSLVVIPLRLKENDLLGGGSLVILTEGDRKITEHDSRLLSMLREPFAIAMSNALKHKSELKLYSRDFFWEASKRILGHLKIEEGLKGCLEFIKNFMPVDEMYLEQYKPDLESMLLIARADSESCKPMDTLVKFNHDAKKTLHDLAIEFRKGELPPVIVINNAEEEPVTKCMLDALNIPMSSALSLPLVIDGHSVGTVVTLARGNNRYSEEHASLFALLKEPFFVAMHNTITHLEVLKLKDLLADENRYLHNELRRLSGDEIIGANFGLKDVMFKVQQVAALESPVLLLGETGTGKDVIANAIHYSSSRSEGPFVSVNCGAIPESLIDSELFGHEKGAFTGALSQKRGRFERANGGTIFLDEIGELPYQAQSRLLKVLQDKEIERVGGVETIKLDIRVIAATNRDLETMIRNNEFREDLWFRLNVFPITIPPLRDRRSDIPSLLQYFINQKSHELKLQSIPKLKPGAIDSILDYHWPGNVRELENVVERELILNPKGPLNFDHLKQTYSNQNKAIPQYNDEIITLDAMTRNHIKSALKKTKGKIHGDGGAAELLGVNASTLRNRMNKLGIDYRK